MIVADEDEEAQESQEFPEVIIESDEESTQERPYSYSLKVIRPRSQGGSVVEKFQAGTFLTPHDIEVSVKRILKDKRHMIDSEFEFGYMDVGHGVKGKQYALETNDDVTDMYEIRGGGSTARLGGRELTLLCGFSQYTLLQNRDNSVLLGTPLYCWGGDAPPMLKLGGAAAPPWKCMEGRKQELWFCGLRSERPKELENAFMKYRTVLHNPMEPLPHLRRRSVAIRRSKLLLKNKFHVVPSTRIM